VDHEPRNPFQGFRIEVDPERVEETLTALRDRVEETVSRGRYTKVRLSYRGKAIGPDVPLSLILGAEGIAFWVMSPIAALLVNLGAKAFLDVEFIHEADELVREGIDLYLDGEIDAAKKKYEEALRKRSDDPAALYNLGVALRVSGDNDKATEVLRKAAMGPEDHPDVIKASELLERMTSGGRRL
jgi:tetratricopeptide (TPR) repeat protein